VEEGHLFSSGEKYQPLVRPKTIPTIGSK